jgi:hypothetical protein
VLNNPSEVSRVWGCTVFIRLAVLGASELVPSGAWAGDACIVEYVEDFAEGDIQCDCGFDPMFHHAGTHLNLNCLVKEDCALNMLNFRAFDVVTWTLPEAGYEVILASVQMADSCGAGCTSVTFYGEEGSATFENPFPTGGEYLTFSTEGLGLGAIESIELQSFEGWFDNLTIVAAPIGTLVGDVNSDRMIDGADLGLLLSAWGMCGDCGSCAADLDCDCSVDGADLGLLLSGWT